MQKVRTGLLMMAMCASSFFVSVVKGEVNSNVNTNKVYVSQKADAIYDRIDFGNDAPLSKEVFRGAYLGFLNLKAVGKISSSSILSICDFSLSANVKRLWIVDLDQSKVLFHSLVAHGQGTGEEFASRFSNKEGSHQSSMGFFVTADTYNGDNGYSLKLKGMDKGYNDAAYDRSIVIHGADYVCESFIKSNQRLGRSWGCPAVPRALSEKIINTIKDGTCFYIYYPEHKYLSRSVWLNHVPEISADELLKNKIGVQNKKAIKLQTQPGNEMNDSVKDDNYSFQGVKLKSGIAEE